MYRLVSEDNNLKQCWKNPTILAELNIFCCCIVGDSPLSSSSEEPESTTESLSKSVLISP